jgi:hypothetical protein
MNSSIRTVLSSAIVLSAIVALAAGCTGSSGGGPSVPPTAAPSDPAGGGSAGDPGGAIDLPLVPGQDSPGPSDGPTPTVVVAKPGRLDVHPIGATRVEASATGHRVSARLSWWSGVAPCSVLDSVGVVRTGTKIVLTVREGADQRGVACIELAMFKATLVDLGELAPGTYTVSALGEAPPVEVVVD